MNGPEHYAEAERLIAKARSLGGGDTYNSIQVRPQVILAEAQVHATLALSAALGMSPPGPEQPGTRSTARGDERAPTEIRPYRMDRQPAEPSE
jgi:hypothetical protein